jgi:class 3 adenylate cyclase/YHS domain-containing protein
MAEGMTLAQLAEVAGVTVAVLEEWQRLGLLVGRGDAVDALDLERVRVVQFAGRRGFSAARVAEVCAEAGDLLGIHVGMLPIGWSRRGVSFDEAARASGLDPEALGRLWRAAGLVGQDEVYEEDLEALRSLRIALDAGLPEEALAQILRVLSGSLGRVAEAEARLFHHYVHERLRAQGVRGVALTAATEAVAAPLVGLVEPTVAYFHRKAWERAQREDLLVHLGEGAVPPSEVPGELEVAVLFVDLSGFTPLTEVMGDAAAAGLMERFGDLVHQAAHEHHGTVVKQIGDEFMLAFTRPVDAVACGLSIERAVSAEEKFPAVRQGAHAGRALYRAGDYVGATVNIAARVVAEADRHRFLVTGALRDEVGDIADVAFTAVGDRSLKGIAAPVELFAVTPLGDRPRREVDPVCLMDLDPATATIRLSWRGSRLLFCSDDCLARFVAAPDDFAPGSKETSA